MTTSNPKPPKLMSLRKHDRCADCDLELAMGAQAWWFTAERVVRCRACGDAVGDRVAATPIVESDTVTPAPTPEGDDVAGGSAQQQYERRAARELARKRKALEDDAEWRTGLKANHRIIGPVVTAFTPKPTIGPESQSTTAWKTGAEGERRVAEILDALDDIEVLHDRRVPGTRANVDHLAVGPTGVFVIDAKKYDGNLEVRDIGGWFRTDERLYVGGRDRTNLVEGMLWQIDVVRQALGERFTDVPVHGVLCFVGAQWELLFPRPKIVKGVVALWPKALAEHVTRAGDHLVEITSVAEHLRSTLKPAVRGR